MSQDNSRQGITNVNKTSVNTTNVNKLSITKATNRQLQGIASIIEATGQVRPTTNAIVGALVSEAWHTKRWPLIRTMIRSYLRGQGMTLLQEVSEAKPTMLAPKEQPRWLRMIHKIDRLIYSSKGSPMWTYDYRIAFFLHIPDKQQRLGFLKEMSTKQVAVYKRELKKAYHEAIAQEAPALLVSSKRPSKPTADRPIEITEALKPIVLDHEELLCWFEERLAEAAPRRHKQPPKNTFGSRGGTSRITRWRQQKEQQQKALEAKELLAKKQIRKALLRYINETEASFLAGMLPKRGTPKLIRKPIVPKKTSCISHA